MSEPLRPFSLTDPLPRDTTCVLEASAGTGKTYTIAGLVVRYVAEGRCELPQLLVVTFTRAATAELRDRVRQRLVEATAHLSVVLRSGARAAAGDPVLDLLAEAGRDELAVRHRRLTTALTTFDAATISTIHGFCQHVLGGLGIAGDVDRDAALVEDEGEVVERAVDDLLVTRFHDGPDPPLGRGQLLTLAHTVVSTPDATLVPDRDAVDGEAALRVELAHHLRREVDRRKRARQLLSYDDLLTRLAGSLRHPERGEAARALLRERYRVALIDEFQDTDPIQWEVLDGAFGGGAATLVLIGDPKQAIYAFRGADVYAYLGASEGAADRATLAVNWRSDAPLLAAYDTLLAGATFGAPGIRYLSVDAAPGHDRPGLTGLPDAAPLQLKVVGRDLGLATAGRGGRFVQAGAARDHLAGDLTAEVVAMLEAGARIHDPDSAANTHGQEDGPGGKEGRPLEPGDLAVLVRTNAEAAQVQQALLDAHVPAIINGVGSVFATPAAVDWRRLLEALERPSDTRRARALALTSFVGWTCRQVAEAADEDWDRVHERLHAWSAILRDRGVASLLRTVVLQQRLPARLLARPGGERLLTDLEHIGELAHAAAVAEGLGTTALTGWLRERQAEADEIPSDERARRLESDADAVQILTIHRSKGLEFPVVLCPFMWSGGSSGEGVPVFHDRDAGNARRIDVAGKGGWDEFDHHQTLATREGQGEALRLLYVALTRARHRAVVWWAPVSRSDASPLARVLFCRGEDGRVRPCDKASVPDDQTTHRRLGELADRSRGLIQVRPTSRPSARQWEGRVREAQVLSAARFDRGLDVTWHRASYSRLTAGHHHTPTVGSEPDEPVKDDEQLVAAPAVGAPGDGDTGVALPLAGMPGGTEVGTFVHAVLEEVEPTADDLDGKLDRVVAEQQQRRRVDVGERGALLAGLRAALTTPLGPLVDDRALATFTAGERSAELDFELPLGGGSVAAIGELVDAHLPADDPLAGYGRLLRAPAFHHDLRGYLTGSIDLVLRHRSSAGGDRFVVVDHKTNRLGAAATTADYGSAALAEAMVAGHYPLQALLYSVALHRYLRWRQAGYEPATHLGGVLYLFLRGMVGPDTPRAGAEPAGVFAWMPPAALVTAVSDLLDGRGEVAA